MKMKKLLAAALAATMLFSTMVTSVVASAETTTNAVDVTIAEVAVGAETYTANFDITFDTALEAPHLLFDVDATGTLTNVVSNIENEVNINAEDGGTNLAEGLFLVEGKGADKYVSAISLTATFALDAAAVDGDKIDVAVAVTDNADWSENTIEIAAGSATYTVVAPHECTAGTPVPNNDGTHYIPCADACGKNYAETTACTYVDGLCSVCGYAEPGCEHTDANQDGICDNECGYENIDETLAFYNKGILLGADIRGVLQVRKIKADSPYESFKVIAEKIDGSVSELELVATSDKTAHTTYGYAITVPAKEMADIIKARIVGITAEGEAFISNVDTWSIKQGVISSMDTYSAQTSEAYVNRVKLCANMLNYGAEAQKNFSYQLDNLATDGLKAEYAAYIITETPEMAEIPATDDTGATAPLKDIRFNLAARVQILPRFTVPSADAKEVYRAEITQVHTAPDGTVTTKEFTINGADCLKSGTTFAVYVDNLASKELRDVLTVTLYKNDEVVSAAHTFSAESVLVGMLKTKGSLVAALMNYGDCARAVFG